MTRNRFIPTLLAATALTLGGTFSALAQEPEVMEQDGITYISGGIGDDTQQAMKGVADDYNLHVTMAVEEGNYLADTQVQVMDSSGNTVLDTVSTGPLFYANLPAGSYTVMASGFGQSYQETVEVSEGGSADVVFHWNTPGEEGNLDAVSPDDEGEMKN